MVLRSQYGDDCFVPHTATEINLHRIAFGILITGLLVSLVGIKADSKKPISITAAVLVVPILLFEALISGCE
jgi:hypothetical protein